MFTDPFGRFALGRTETDFFGKRSGTQGTGTQRRRCIRLGTDSILDHGLVWITETSHGLEEGLR